MSETATRKPKKHLKYAKWGYFFIAPFFIVYAVFSLYPLLSTFYNSFFENYRVGLTMVGPKFIGLDNYAKVFASDLGLYLKNTFVIWLIGFVPQMIFALLFASWFTDLRLKLKGTGLFKVILYLPNILMASSIAVLFYTIFNNNGPVNQVIGYIVGDPEFKYEFFISAIASQGIAALINYLMWVGNTTILLMAGIMGIDTALYEAAEIDGASAGQIFRKLTLPLLKPIMLYVMITSMIGGIQMFDIPQLLTKGRGNPNNSMTTVIMYLNNNLSVSKNFGVAGAISVVVFAVAAVLSVIVFMMMSERKDKVPKIKKGGKA